MKAAATLVLLFVAACFCLALCLSLLTACELHNPAPTPLTPPYPEFVARDAGTDR